MKQIDKKFQIQSRTLYEVDKLSKKISKIHKVKITPNTKKYVASQVSTSLEKKVIKKEHLREAAAGLLTVGLENSKKYGQNVVKVRDIQKNWQTIKMGPGNCPPNECLFSTIVSRKNEFGEDFPDFNQLMDD